MADARYDRLFAGRYGPDDRFVIEAPQVFCGSAAPGNDDHIRVRPVRFPDSSGNLTARAGALNRYGDQDDRNRRTPHAGNVQDIV